MLYKLLTYDKTELGEELLIVPVKEGIANISMACHLNKTATEIWKYCETLSAGFALDDVIAHVSKTYNIDIETATNDCTKVVNSLFSAGLIALIDEQ